MPGAPAPQQRFVLGESLAGQPEIQAAQGHSVQLESPILEPIAAATQVGVVFH